MGGVSQQLLLPTPADPKLWVVRCGEGQERETIICLLQVRGGGLGRAARAGPVQRCRLRRLGRQGDRHGGWQACRVARQLAGSGHSALLRRRPCRLRGTLRVNGVHA